MKAPTHLPHGFDPFFEKMKVTMACQVPGTYHVTVKPPELLHLQRHEPHNEAAQTVNSQVPYRNRLPFLCQLARATFPSSVLLSCHKVVDQDTQKAAVGSELGSLFLAGSITR